MSDGATPGRRPSVLPLAALLGTLCGLGEGLGFLWFQERGGSRWAVAYSVGSEIVWTAVAADLLLFVALSGLLAGGFKLARRTAPVWLVAGFCAALLAYDWSRLTMQHSPRFGAAAALAVAVATVFCVRGREAVVVRVARRALPFVLALPLLLAAAIEIPRAWSEHRAVAALPPAPAGARNVVVIVLDTVRADHLSVYGYPRETSPVLETLAREGARFDACFSTSSWTLPAHASMLTGRLPFEHGATLGPLDATWPTLGERFAAYGWRTGGFSGNLCFFNRRYGFARGFHRFDDFSWSLRDRLLRTLFGRELNTLLCRFGGFQNALIRKSAEDVNAAFLDWLDEAEDTPFFAFLNYFDAHDEYFPPPAVAGRFAGDGLPPPSAATPSESARLAKLAQAYDECIAWCDQQVGELVAGLRARGQLDRTVLAIVSDHGEAFGERGALLHRGSLNREQTHVPLLLRAPGVVPAGRVIEAVTSVTALPNTLLAGAGCPVDETFPAPSLLPWFTEEGAATEDASALLELAQHPWAEYRKRPCHRGALQSVVVGPWHYVVHETDGEQLFHWQSDPREEQDVIEQHRDIAAALGARMRAELEKLTPHRGAAGLDAEGKPREDLAGIGYMGKEH